MLMRTRKRQILYIVNAVKKGDIVITCDIGLAGTLLPKGSLCSFSKGKGIYR